MSDARVFYLPDVGEGLTEAEIVTWHVSVGDEVSVNDALVDVETAKSVVELPSPFAGTVTELHGAPGEVLPVGAALVSIEDSFAESNARPPEASTRPGDESSEAPPSDAHEPSSEADRTPAATMKVADEPAAPSAGQPLILVGTGPKEAATRRVRVRRPVGVSAAEVRGRFRRPDSDGSASAHGLAQPRTETLVESPVSSQTARPPLADERIPIRGVRKATAEAMVRSAFTAPHATVWTSVDVTRTMEAVRRLRNDRSWRGVRISPLLFVAKATALAVRRFPEVNATWDDESNEIVLKHQLNLGIAVATPRGLLVPNIKDAGSLDMRQLAEALDHTIAEARVGKLAPADMARGTLTLTNVGTLGIEGAAPIINPPEAIIVALGAVNPRPWVVDGAVVVRDVMTLSISVDHRLVDGQLAGEVLRFIADVLADPGATMHLAP